MSKLFISHSSLDDAIVRELQQALGDLHQDVWIDSRELRGGELLWPEIQQAIEQASAYAVLVSTDALQSKWVGKELRHALDVQKQRGSDQYPVIPLSINGTKLGVLEEFFGAEPLYIPVSSGAGGIDVALNAILVALGKRLPADVPVAPQPQAEPLEELVLELTDLKFHELDGVRRAAGRAKLVYEPATPGQRNVQSISSWRFVAPLGPIEAEELRWYLEKYAIWPSEYFRDRAQKVEKNLLKWGQLLHEAAMPAKPTANVMQAWARIDGHAGRRFSVHVDATLDAGAPDADVATAREAATLLLGLPWELLHDGDGFLFQGAKPTRVRRRLPNTRVLDVPVVATPIRILLVTARPEDEACGYLDHRASALPLVEAMEALGGLVRLQVLSPPTLPALREELDRARRERQPYHVVHFDGHGVYNRQVGLGGLCFEDPQDIGKLEGRRHQTVYTDELGPLLKDHRIPLVFLEACQTAMSEDASESVASELLNRGVASVVAMSHSVLVETARRFVEAFYRSLAGGARVGDAMLAGQRALKDDNFRGRIFAVGELRLEDWFVPVLYQEKDDPQLFTSTTARQTREDLQTALAARLGELPAEPPTGFIGRSRELLALQRLLYCSMGPRPVRPIVHGPGAHATVRYVVIRGQGGEGKTALASELTRWLVRSGQVRRAAFVSVELHSTLPAVLDAIGRQLLPDYSVATFDDLDRAIQAVERALQEQSTLLVIDNMESILLPPFVEHVTPEALSAEARRELESILALCARLITKGDTRIVFTSRESLPAPFDNERNRRELHKLDREDAVKLVERTLNADDLALPHLSHPSHASHPSHPSSNQPAASAVRLMADAQQESIEQLVDAVHCHARTLALLAPSLRSRSVEKTRESLVALMAEMEQKFPGSREQSVYASVELSLRRMSPANRDRAQVLGVFHGGFWMPILQLMMQWDEADVESLAVELVATGLATPNRYNHLTLNPALCPYLCISVGRLSESSAGEASRLGESCNSNELTARWVEAMRGYVGFLYDQQSQNVELAATLTVLELPNLFALLEQIQFSQDAEATIALATSLFGLLQFAGKPRLLERIGQVRDAAAAALGNAWNHARFQAARTNIEQQLACGRLREALRGAEQLLQRARAAGEQAYSVADYDLAMACLTLARSLKTGGGSEEALPLLDEARQRLDAIVQHQGNEVAALMESVCFAERGECLFNLGRLSEASAAYDENLRRAERMGDERQVAVGNFWRGNVCLQQHLHHQALLAYEAARKWFTGIDEPAFVAVIWHQIGNVYQFTGQSEAAEDAYRKSLVIRVRLGDIAGQADTLNELGILYDHVLGRTEEAVGYLRQAADKYVENQDKSKEGLTRGNLAIRLKNLRLLDEARREVRQAIELGQQFGNASSPWMWWSVLADIETDAGMHIAAAEAKRKAIACYLTYRHDGGENHDGSGRLAFDVTESLVTGDTTAAATLLEQLAADPDLPSHSRTFIRALQAIVAGSRDRTLADAPELDYSMAAEILFLIETLERK